MSEKKFNTLLGRIADFIDDAPRFDGKEAGWYVYPPGSSHHPTVQGGDAYVLYFLPEGAIEFTGK